MNRLTEEQIDEIIKSEFKKDDKISDKANSVFQKFCSEQFINQKLIQEKNNELNHNKNNINNKKEVVIDMNFYKKLNKILGVVAVSLTVIIIGGSAVYFNKNNVLKNINNTNSQNETIIYTQNNLVQNEKLQFSNEQILKEVELKFVKVYMLGKRDIGVNLSSHYWDEFGVEVNSTDCYKLTNITEDVSDIFIGEIGGAGLPYVFLLMEDGTIQYVDLHCYNNVFKFEAAKLEGLNNVIGFEQKTRKYSSSTRDYEYVNAIRSDGLRKEIEIGIVNNWNDSETVNYNKLNEKYVKAHSKEKIIDDGKGDFTVDNITYLNIMGENEYVYYQKNNNFYRVKKDNFSEQCIASGITGFVRNYSDGRLSVYVGDKFEIYSLDKNIVFKNTAGQIFDEITVNKDNSQNTQQISQTVKTDFSFMNKFSNRMYVSEIKVSRGACYYELEFDADGKPMITVQRKVGEEFETIGKYSEFYNIVQDTAAGSCYTRFDGKNLIGSESEQKFEIMYSNVTENNSIILSTDLRETPGDYIEMSRIR